MDFAAFTQALANTSWTACATYAALGAAAGAIAVPLLIFLAIKFNYRRLRDAYAGFVQDASFYRLFAAAGAALFALLFGMQPLLDAAGDNEVYFRAASIPMILVVIGVPFTRRLKRFRKPL